MKHFSTCKKLTSCFENRKEASTSLVLDETERSKVLLYSNKNFRKYAAVLIKMLYDIRKSTPNQNLNKAR